MKQYPWKFKLRWDGIEWWQSEKTLNTGSYFYYVYWFNFINDKQYRKLGFDYMYYDGPHRAFVLWWFNITWSTPWTKVEKYD
jgi:hypothetical protein